MERENFNLDAYNLNFIKTKKFKTVLILVCFRNLINKKDITYRNLLPNILLEGTKKYPESRLLNIETENLYGVSAYINNTRFGNQSALMFDFKMLNEKYTELGMYEKSLDFLFEIILNPDVENNSFKSNHFKLVKNNFESYIKSIKDDKAGYSFIRLQEEMDKEGDIPYRKGYLEELEKINEQNLYEYYKYMLNNDILDIYIIGDVDIEKTKDIFASKFISNRTPVKIELQSVKCKNLKEQVIVEKEKIMQAKLSIGCNLDNLTDFEKKYVMSIYSTILGGGMTSKLFTNVREKHSLAYSIGSKYSLSDNKLYVLAGINHSDYEKALELIKIEMNNMLNGNFTEEDLDKAKKDRISNIETIEDSIDKTVFSTAQSDLFDLDPLDERIKKYLSISLEDVIKVSKKVKIDTIFLLTGDDANE
ncbi:MAG: pitrilysin family protein [Bacilli bacterium]|nr:pitrilysin family protein [Bacilli bacterium]